MKKRVRDEHAWVNLCLVNDNLEDPLPRELILKIAKHFHCTLFLCHNCNFKLAWDPNLVLEDIDTTKCTSCNMEFPKIRKHEEMGTFVNGIPMGVLEDKMNIRDLVGLPVTYQHNRTYIVGRVQAAYHNYKDNQIRIACKMNERFDGSNSTFLSLRYSMEMDHGVEGAITLRDIGLF